MGRGGTFPQGTPVSFTLQCTLGAIAEIDTLIRSAVQQLDLESSLQPRLRLIVEELLTNVVTHGQSPPDGSATVQLCRSVATQLVLDWTDPGQPFDPRSRLPQDTRNAELEDRTIGGLGWPLILSYCRIHTYTRTGDCNHLRLLMELPASPDANDTSTQPPG